jgi:hypothetical protein
MKRCVTLYPHCRIYDMPSNIAQNNFLKVFSMLSLRCVNVFNIKILSMIFQALGTQKRQIRGKHWIFHYFLGVSWPKITWYKVLCEYWLYVMCLWLVYLKNTPVIVHFTRRQLNNCHTVSTTGSSGKHT